MEIQAIPPSSLLSAPPVMPWAKFAEWIGVEEGVCHGWCQRGYLPTFKIGRHQMVNVELFRKQLCEAI